MAYMCDFQVASECIKQLMINVHVTFLRGGDDLYILSCFFLSLHFPPLFYMTSIGGGGQAVVQAVVKFGVFLFLQRRGGGVRNSALKEKKERQFRISKKS